jgi:hypothetical protein
MKKVFTIMALFGMFAGAVAQQSELIISEYVEGWSNNKALELFNPTSSNVNLGDFRLIRYSNGEDVPPPLTNWIVNLPDKVLEPYRAFVIVIDKRDPNGSDQEAPVWSQLQQRADVFLCPVYAISEAMYFNGDDALVIEKDEGGGEFIIHDIFGRWGEPAPALAQFVNSDKIDNAWTDVAPYFTGEGFAVTAEHSMIRKSNVATGVTANPTVFNPLAEYDTLPANTFDMLGWHEFDNAPANETPVLTNEKLTFGVSPTATNGTVITTFTATDAEEDELKFYLDYGNFIYIDDERIEPFSLDQATGELTLVDQNGLAPEVLDTFNITLNITDGYSQLGPVYAKVIVTDEEVNVEENFSPLLNVHPNPAANRFRIQADRPISGIHLYSLSGKLVLREAVGGQALAKEINSSGIDPGIYFLRVKFSDQLEKTVKVVLK